MMTKGRDDEACGEEWNWYPANLARIREVFAASSGSGDFAVFDFDNTCIFGDVGQAIFRRQLLDLDYRISPADFAALLPVAPSVQVAGRPLAAITEALCASYARLWPLIAEGKSEQARQSKDYPFFTCLLLWFVQQARQNSHFGPLFVLPFMAKLLAGYAAADLRQTTVTMLREVMAEPLAERALEVSAPEPVGSIRASYSTGLRAHEEMKALMTEARQRGIAICVISATAECLIREAVRVLGFPVEEKHIFGIRIGLDGQGNLNTRDEADYPVTFRQGKTAVIRRFIGVTPLLVAGDADTDYDMLTMPGVAARLLINRQQRGLISSLYQRPDILLQGLDLRTGCFRSSRETIS